MATILISAPSLDATKNVSGVSSVVRNILSVLSGTHDFVHLELGSEQKGSRLARLAGSLGKIARGAGLAAFGRYDLFHSNTAANKSALVRDGVFMMIAGLRGKPVIWHVHGGAYMTEPASGWAAGLMRLLARRTTSVIVLGHAEKAYFAKHAACDPAKITVIYNGIVPPEGHAARMPEGGPLSVIFAGRLSHEKGIDLLLESVARLAPDDGIRVDVYGDGPLRAKVEAAAGPVLTYGGTLTPQGVIEAMQGYQALILPSLFGEGMPMVIVEAMSLGVIPVCTPISSVPEIIRDRESGVLITPDPESLCGALAWLREDAARTAAVGVEARAFARGAFDARKNFGQLDGIYSALIAK